MGLTWAEAHRLAAGLFANDPEAASSDRSSSKNPANAAVPELIGGYRVIRLIGEGGMGTVYRAEQLRPSRLVAIKLLKWADATASARDRFEREAEILAHLNHPGIAQVYSAGLHDDGTGSRPYLVMEFVPGARSIIEYCQAEMLSPKERLALFLKVCEAVDHGHRKAIIHRDLKPGNILVDRDGAIRVIDFGVAKALNRDVPLVALQTGARELLGTPQYMSPEQSDGRSHEVGTATDVYALGLVLYELLSDDMPYEVPDTSITDAALIIREVKPRPLHHVWRTSRRSIALNAVVQKALAKDFEQRYATAGELGRDIQRFLRGDPVDARPSTRWQRMASWVQRYPVWTTSVTCLLIAVVTVAMTFGVVWYLKRQPYRVSLSPDGHEAYVYTLSGEVAHTWRLRQDRGRIAFLDLVERTGVDGPNKIILVGTSHLLEPDVGGTLAAFDLHGDLTRPLWTGGPGGNEIPPELKMENGEDRRFSFSAGCVADVLPDEDHPGLEVVASFTSSIPDDTSSTCIRVLSLAGECIASYWHQGTIGYLCWLEDPQVLVCGGCPPGGLWTRHGRDDSGDQYVRAVFAIVPEANGLENLLITPDQNHQWYRALHPSSVYADFEMVGPVPGHLRDDPAATFRMHFISRRNPYGAGISLLFNAQGNLVHAPEPNDVYVSEVERGEIPAIDLSILRLGPLPPREARED